jgi:hypothetical protein
VHAFSLAAEQVEDLNGRAVVDWVERGRAAAVGAAAFAVPGLVGRLGDHGGDAAGSRCRRIARDE